MRPRMWDEARTTCTRNEDRVQNDEALKRKGGSERYKKKSRKEFGTGKANVTNKAKKTNLVANKTSNETEEKNRRTTQKPKVT